MPAQADQSVRAHPIPGGTRFHLPPPRGIQRLIGIPLLAFAVLFALPAFPFFVVPALVPAGLGLILLFAKPDFDIVADRFRAAPRFGPIRLGKWRPIESLERLSVERFAHNPDSAHYVLKAHVGDDRPLNLTGATDPALLERIAHDIALAVNPDNPPAVTSNALPAPADAALAPEILEVAPPDPGDPPPSATLWCEQTATGPTIFIPPTGFRAKTPRFFLFFALFWIALTTFVGGIFLSSGSGPGITTRIFITIFFGVFEVVGLLLLVTAFSHARRRAILDVTDQGRTLLVTRSGLFKSSQRTIPRADITAVRMDDSGTSVNNQPLKQLRIEVRGHDNDVEMLVGRPQIELLWLTRKLRHALAIPE